MADSFMPPNIESLADVEIGDVCYENECVVIQGIVSPKSQSDWAGKNDGYKVHCFTFAAWRRPGALLVKRNLTILRPVPPDEDYSGSFPAYSIHRISVLLSTDGKRAVFEKSLPLREADSELVALEDELRKPVVISTKTFGDLVLDHDLDWFEGIAEWNGESITVDFRADENGSIDNALKTAEQLWADQASWKRRVDELALDELLELKNGSWLEEGESALTPYEFLERMELESISISSAGEFEFWFNDGDLFWGHAILVSGTLEDGPTDASISG